MRLLIGFALLFLYALPARAQIDTVDRVQVIRVGTWTQGADDKLTPARTTDTISAQVGTIFGVEWRAYGRPANGAGTVKVKWTYPAPGMRNPITRAFKASDEFDYAVAFGARTITYLELHSDTMIIPGKWVLEIAQTSNLLVRQEFNIAP
jgi:hypothetical protein